MANGRDSKGRYLPGTSGNPNGRPRESLSDDQMKTIMHRLTQEEWDDIVDVGIARAKSGDVAWARFLANYRWGKPIERRIVEQASDVRLEWGDDEDNATSPSS